MFLETRKDQTMKKTTDLVAEARARIDNLERLDSGGSDIQPGKPGQEAQ